MKIAFIGAGSVGFTIELIRDLLSVPELQNIELALHDIDADGLGRVAAILRRDIAANRLPTRVTTHQARQPAIEGARYILNCARIGGLAAFETDVEIPMRYGIDQCVGDTLCAGGIFYGQRSIPAILDFCRDIRAHAEPGAWFLNYANPMAMNTWAAIEHGGLERTIGLCHGVQHGWVQIAEVLGAADPRELDYLAAGINHQTWYLDLRLNGRPIDGEELLAAFERHPRWSREERLRIDVLRRFGHYSTESSGHLSEYLPWYRRTPAEIESWIDRSHWINGESGGYLRACRAMRHSFAEDHARLLADAGKPLSDHVRSEEHASYIIEAFETGRPYRGHFNVRNDGIITNLPADCIVESVGVADRFGLNMTAGITLPLACAATCARSIDVQRMAVKAAVTGDRALLRLALMHDPLTGAVATPDAIWHMADEMLTAQRQWLPQYG